MEISGNFLRISAAALFLQNLTQLQILLLANTGVSGSVTSLSQLTVLRNLNVRGTQVGAPTQDQLATFKQQHPSCFITHGH